MALGCCTGLCQLYWLRTSSSITSGLFHTCHCCHTSFHLSQRHRNCSVLPSFPPLHQYPLIIVALKLQYVTKYTFFVCVYAQTALHANSCYHESLVWLKVSCFSHTSNTEPLPRIFLDVLLLYSIKVIDQDRSTLLAILPPMGHVSWILCLFVRRVGREIGISAS